jgi:hypothetical protein
MPDQKDSSCTRKQPVNRTKPVAKLSQQLLKPQRIVVIKDGNFVAYRPKGAA